MLGTDQSIPMSCEENVKVQRIKVLRPSLKPLCPRLQKSTSLSFKLPSCFSFKTKGESSQSFGIVSLTKLGGRPPALTLGKTTSNKESDKDYANQAVILTSSELLTPAPRLLKPVNLHIDPSSGTHSPKAKPIFIHRSDPLYVTKGSMEENVKASPISTNSFRAMRGIKTIDLNSKTALGLSVGDNSAQNRDRSLTPGSQEDQRTASGILAVSPQNYRQGSTLTGKIQSQSTMGAAKEGPADTSNTLTGANLKTGRLGHRPSASMGVRGSREVANVGLSGTNNELPAGAALSDKEKSKSDDQRERDISPPPPELVVRPSWQSHRAQASVSPPSQRAKGQEQAADGLGLVGIGRSYNAQENITEQEHDSSDSMNEDIQGVDPDEAFSLDLVSARRMKITDGQDNQSEGEKESDLEIRNSRIKMNMHKGSLHFISPQEFEQAFFAPSAIENGSRKNSVADPMPRKNSEKPATSTNYTSMRHSTGMTSKLSSYRQGQLSKFSPMFGGAPIGDTGDNKQTDEFLGQTEQKLSVNYSQIVKINKKLKQENIVIGADGIPVTTGHRRGGSFNIPNKILNFKSNPYNI